MKPFALNMKKQKKNSKRMNNNTLEQYQLLNRIEQQLIELNDDALTFYFEQVKEYVITRPSIDSKYLEFYTRVLSKEHEFLLDDATSDNIETVINIIVSTSDKIKSLTVSDT